MALARGQEVAVFHFSSICSRNKRQVSGAINTERWAGALSVWRSCWHGGLAAATAAAAAVAAAAAAAATTFHRYSRSLFVRG